MAAIHMNLCIRLLLITLLAAQASKAEPPPGFELIRISSNSDYETALHLNNCGQLAYTRRMGSTWNLAEIFLYDNEHLIRITQNNDRDTLKEINDHARMLWLRGTGSSGATMVVSYEFGDESVLWTDDDGVSGCALANSGHMVFEVYRGDGCQGVDTDLLFWDGISVVPLVEGNGSHQSVKLNNLDQITWTDYDFCVDPWQADILLYDAGERHRISPDERFQRQVPSINDSGQIAWPELVELEGGGFLNTIMLWEDGTISMFTDWGEKPSLNSHGDIAFYRWYEDERTRRAWLYYQGQFFELTDGSEMALPFDINDYGEVALAMGPFPATDVGLLRRMRTGEADFDGDIDLTDYNKFAECMSGVDWLERNRVYPTDTLCECRFLDLDHDNDVDLADWAKFQNAFAP